MFDWLDRMLGATPEAAPAPVKLDANKNPIASRGLLEQQIAGLRESIKKDPQNAPSYERMIKLLEIELPDSSYGHKFISSGDGVRG